MSFEQFVSTCVPNFIALYMDNILSFWDNEKRGKNSLVSNKKIKSVDIPEKKNIRSLCIFFIYLYRIPKELVEVICLWPFSLLCTPRTVP